MHALLYLSSAVLIAGCAKSPTSRTIKVERRPTVSEIATSYMSYSKMTEQPVFVDPELAMLCIGAHRKQVEAASRTKGPHAHSAILVYMNELAADAFTDKSNKFPVGSVVVKKKTLLGYRDDSGKGIGRGDKGVGGMVKRSPRYDSANGDWEYFYFDDPANIESGRMESCIRCHKSAKSSDYVFGTWAALKPG